jgi:phosphatidylserine/phosphatidylglycerophosphate/cardiolipin synthase-like enzyme
LVIEPADSMSEIYSFMESASKSLDMTMYELADPTAEQILAQDAARGVDVRVLLDKAYHGGDVNAAAYTYLHTHGVHVMWAYSGTIFHQKTIIVDNTESCIMTMNLTARYYSTSRDMAVFDTNPADVAAIVSVFNQDFTGAEPGPGLPGSGNLVWSPGSTGSMVALIDSATTSLDIESEEMSDPTIVAALVAAAKRGVDVRIVMTASTSWDNAFSQIVAAGGHVATYPESGSLYIHAKYIDVDDQTVLICSENFSRASLDYNRELGLIIHSPAVAAEVAESFASDFAGATPYSG